MKTSVCCAFGNRKNTTATEKREEKNLPGRLRRTKKNGNKIIQNTYFTVSEYGEEQRQTFSYKLLTIVIGTDL